MSAKEMNRIHQLLISTINALDVVPVNLKLKKLKKEVVVM